MKVCPKCGSKDVYAKGNEYLCGNCMHKYQYENEGFSLNPQKLFISYGHPEKEIVHDIVDSLQKRGHEVWFDESHIKAGKNWRREITDGIYASTGVVSCLSKHSVRNPGVCLDELSIAIGVKGGNIKTILLEPEEVVQPPSSLGNNQWLDMSQWRDEKKKDTYSKWFQTKMNELFRIVESKESIEFVGQISYIKEILQLPTILSSKETELLRQELIGRKWLVDRVEEWLNNSASEKICCIFGDPGIGKSAFAAHFVHYSPRVAASFFCEYSKVNFNEPSAVIKQLAYKLACRLPDYRKNLIGQLDVIKVDNSVAELFDLLIISPFKATVDGSRENLCIVIDGLDEAGNNEQNSLANALMSNADQLPKWLKILITSRNISIIRQYLGDRKILELTGSGIENLKDIRFYFASRLMDFNENSDFQAILDILVEKSRGCFLYAKLITESIVKGQLCLTDLDELPNGLSQAFTYWFGWMFRDISEYRSVYQNSLSLLLYYRTPLPTIELERLLQWSKYQVNEFLLKIEVLTIKSKDFLGNEFIELSHKYIREWLLSESAGVYQVFISDIEKRVSDQINNFYEENGISGLNEYESILFLNYMSGNKREKKYGKIFFDENWIKELFRIIDSYIASFKVNEVHTIFNQLYICIERYILETSSLLLWQAKIKTKYASFLFSIGKVKESDECYVLGIENAEKLVRQFSSIQHKRCLAENYFEYAKFLRDINQVDKTEMYYHKSILLREEIKKQIKENYQDLSDLEKVYSSYGLFMSRQQNNSVALEYYEKSMILRRGMLLKNNKIEDKYYLSLRYHNLAFLYKRLENYQLAQKYLEMSITLKEELMEERGNFSDQTSIINGYASYGIFLELIGKESEAVEVYRKSIEICECIYKERGSFKDQSNLGRAYHMLANSLTNWERFDEAKNLYELAIFHKEGVFNKRGTYFDLNRLGFSYHKYGVLLTKIKRFDLGEDFFKRSIDVRTKLVDKRNLHIDYRHLAETYYEYGIFMCAKSQFSEANGLFDKSIAILENLNTNNNSENYRRLILSYNKKNMVLVYLNDVNIDNHLFENLKRVQKLENKEKVFLDLEVQAEVYFSYAQYLVQSSKVDLAESYFNKVVKIREDLKGRRGQYSDYIFLFKCYKDYSAYLCSVKNIEKEKLYREKTIQIQEEIQKKKESVF